MQGVQLFRLASEQARWLGVRQAAVAGNIANANTPGYVAMDVEPFQTVLSRASSAPLATQVGHLLGAPGDRFAVKPQDDELPLLPTGTAVTLEKELMKAGEVRRAFELNAGIVKAFHRMMLMTAKG